VLFRSGIVHAVKATLIFLDRMGFPPIDPENIFVLAATNRGNGCITIEALSVVEMTAALEGPGGDVHRVPELTRARDELLEKRAEGASEGVILWAQDDENNYFIVPIGKLTVEGINASGGEA
jgi:hypothetical protein